MRPTAPLPRRARAYGADVVVPEADPAREISHYCQRLWVQHLAPIRTRCWRCKKDSPVVYVPAGVILFGTKPSTRSAVDVTKEAVMAFAASGWKFQLHRSYCPDCKNLGAI